MNTLRTPVDEAAPRMGSIGPGGEPLHPSGDERFRAVDAAMKRYRYQQDALIEVLHAAQEAFGVSEAPGVRCSTIILSTRRASSGG